MSEELFNLRTINGDCCVIGISSGGTWSKLIPPSRDKKFER